MNKVHFSISDASFYRSLRNPVAYTKENILTYHFPATLALAVKPQLQCYHIWVSLKMLSKVFGVALEKRKQKKRLNHDWCLVKYKIVYKNDRLIIIINNFYILWSWKDFLKSECLYKIGKRTIKVHFKFMIQNIYSKSWIII